MNKKLERYVNSLFKNAPRSKKIYELKEEILANLNDKYSDLLGMGYGEEEAYSKAISNIGDIEELIEGSGVEVCTVKDRKEYRQKSGLRIAIAVMLYILSPTAVILIQSEIGVVILLSMVAIATGILIYNAYQRPRGFYFDEQEEMVFSKENIKRKNINSAICSITVAIYIIVSFTFGNWHISWVIFIIGSAVENIMKAYFDLKEEEDYE